MTENTIDTDIVELLRWLAKSAKPMDANPMRIAADEIERLRITPEEREAIRFALGRLYGTLRGNEECDHADALRGLLERLG